jgi:cellulose synthase/poly-beta-1,6-N-acetylglucosamine synthase-like glycosyltransferase
MTAWATWAGLAGWTVAVVAGALAVHAGVNAALLRRPPARPPRTGRSVAVLLPLRDEAHRVEPCLRALLAQRDVPDLEIVVLDDGSADGTADVVRAVAGDKVRLLTGAPLPAGWLGKPHACAQLAAATGAEILVFVDADVVLAPHAVAAAVALLEDGEDVDLVSPYPKIIGQPLVQPLLQWSWLTFLPLRAMERSRRPSLASSWPSGPARTRGPAAMRRYATGYWRTSNWPEP